MEIDVRSDPHASVLIVDDDAYIRDVLRLVFEIDGFEVAEASCGTDALTCALRESFEFIVLDYLMPGMAGDKVAPVLRTLVPDARIVAFSASLDEKPEWADAFLNKERIDEISDLLTRLLQPRAAL